MPFGPYILPDAQGVLFRLWAPSAKSIELVTEGIAYPMQPTQNGWFETVQPEAGVGTSYQFRVDDALQVPDPASRYQPQDVHGSSEVIDPDRFNWEDADWKGRPWEETVLYELHVGTFSRQGTFKGVEEKLDYLVDLGITAIELMPISEFPGERNWGYDGTLHFAPDSRYGRPEDLKSLVQTAHAKGLMVFLDVVYNHFGPEGNYLYAYAKDFFTDRYQTPWGAAINFEGPHQVRDFFVENALFWLNEYHFDGLRLDAVHAIRYESKPHFLMELAHTVRERLASDRHVHLVLENDDNDARFLSPVAHDGYVAQWNDDFHHAMHVVCTGENTGYYVDYAAGSSSCSAIAHLGRCLAEGFAYQGEESPYRDNIRRGEKSDLLPPTAFVNFLQNHDQIGNRAMGDRLASLSTPEALRSALAILLLAPSIPLLFMGQEWETRRPFQFFCDFGSDLAPLVTEGRRREFARFPEFSDPATWASIPDPSDANTFEASRLDWSELKQSDHAAWLDYYRTLLRLRHKWIIPLLTRLERGTPGAHCYELLDRDGLSVTWSLQGGERLKLIANLGKRPCTLNAIKNVESHCRFIYQSSDSLPALFASGAESGEIPPWSVYWLLKEA